MMQNVYMARSIDRGRSLVVTFLAAALILPFSGAITWAADAHALWQDFRSAFPFHVQTVAVSDLDEDGSRVLIVSEPPPGFGAGEVRAALAAAFPGQQVLATEPERTRMGYDGWVEDLVVTLGPEISDMGAAVRPMGARDRRLKEVVSYLSRAVFSTSYKAYALHLPVVVRDPASLLRQAPASLSVGAAELKRWLLDDGRRFVRAEGSEPASVESLAASGTTGAYLSAEPGLALLLLRRDQDIASTSADLRKFALDSDLILGAVALGERDLAIVGRERQTALDVLPPLRTESILALAAAHTTELAQSYERRRVFAGRIEDGEDAGRDWAPIYLSDQLVDTEIGSLLNLTDQLLKSWSQAGHTEYVSFPYPKPDEFPFGSKPLSDLTGGGRTLFNWNTTGMGSVTEFGQGVRVYALNRTGSLPVTYGSDAGSADNDVQIGQLTAFEEKAYDYFTSRRDPNLARVVQYTALYQIFQAFPVLSASPPRPDVASVGNAVRSELALWAAAGLETLANLAHTELSRLQRIEAGASAAVGDQKEGAAVAAPALQPPDDGASVVAPEDDESSVPEPVFLAGLNVLRLGAEFGPEVIDTLAEILADPRGTQPSPAAFAKLDEINAGVDDDDGLFAAIKALPESERKSVLDAMLLEPSRQFRDILTALSNLGVVRDSVVSATEREPPGHIRTASTVLSWDTVDVESVGGHNLDSAVTRVETSPGVARGKVSVVPGQDGTTTLRVNPDDASAAGPLARTYARNAEDPELAAKLEQTLAQTAGAPSRALRTALGLEPKVGGRGLTEAEARGFVFDGQSFHSIPQRFTAERFAQARALAERMRYDLIVERFDDGGFVIFRAKPPGVIDAETTPALVELMEGQVHGVAAGHPPRVLFRNFADGEVDGLVRSSDLRSLVRNGGEPPPPPPGSLVATAPGGPERPFIHLSYGADGQPRRLHVAWKEGARERDAVARAERVGNIEAAVARIDQQPNWAKAEIKQVAFEETPVVGGRYANHYQLDFEVTIPISRVGAAKSQSLPLRIAAFVKRVLGRADIERAEIGVRTTLENSARRGLGMLDGIDELKQSLERTLGTSGIEFYLREGAGDLIIVELERSRNLHEPSGRGNGLLLAG